MVGGGVGGKGRGVGGKGRGVGGTSGGRVHACPAVTCHLHFWQNGRGLLLSTAVTRGWNGYRNKSQHRKLTLEKKILPPLLPGLEPATFRSRVQRSNH